MTNIADYTAQQNAHLTLMQPNYRANWIDTLELVLQDPGADLMKYVLKKKGSGSEHGTVNYFNFLGAVDFHKNDQSFSKHQLTQAKTWIRGVGWHRYKISILLDKFNDVLNQPIDPKGELMVAVRNAKMRAMDKIVIAGAFGPGVRKDVHNIASYTVPFDPKMSIDATICNVNADDSNVTKINPSGLAMRKPGKDSQSTKHGLNFVKINVAKTMLSQNDAPGPYVCIVDSEGIGSLMQTIEVTHADYSMLGQVNAHSRTEGVINGVNIVRVSDAILKQFAISNDEIRYPMFCTGPDSNPLCANIPRADVNRMDESIYDDYAELVYSAFYLGVNRVRERSIVDIRAGSNLSTGDNFIASKDSFKNLNFDID